MQYSRTAGPDTGESASSSHYGALLPSTTTGEESTKHTCEFQTQTGIINGLELAITVN